MYRGGLDDSWADAHKIETRRQQHEGLQNG